MVCLFCCTRPYIFIAPRERAATPSCAPPVQGLCITREGRGRSAGRGVQQPKGEQFLSVWKSSHRKMNLWWERERCAARWRSAPLSTLASAGGSRSLSLCRGYQISRTIMLQIARSLHFFERGLWSRLVRADGAHYGRCTRLFTWSVPKRERERKLRARAGWVEDNWDISRRWNCFIPLLAAIISRFPWHCSWFIVLARNLCNGTLLGLIKRQGKLENRSLIVFFTDLKQGLKVWNSYYTINYKNNECEKLTKIFQIPQLLYWIK